MCISSVRNSSKLRKSQQNFHFLLRDAEVAGSNPVISTITGHRFWYNAYLDWCSFFMCKCLVFTRVYLHFLTITGSASYRNRSLQSLLHFIPTHILTKGRKGVHFRRRGVHFLIIPKNDRTVAMLGWHICFCIYSNEWQIFKNATSIRLFKIIRIK